MRRSASEEEKKSKSKLSKKEKVELQKDLQIKGQQLNLFNDMMKKLKTIMALDPAQFAQIKTVSGNEQALAIAKLAIQNINLKKMIDETFQKLKEAKPVEVGKFDLAYTQEGLQDLARHSRVRESLHIASPIDYENQLYSTYDFDEVRSDAKVLLSTLAIRSSISRTPDGIIEQPVSDIKDKKIDAIMVMGNNDLTQIDNVAYIYNQLKQSGNPPKRIYISGFGGHGTSPGYIFGSTEAETMAEELKKLGIPESILRIEREAVDSGKNILFTTPMIKKDFDHPINLLISGTPAGIFRQSRSFEQQAKDVNWSEIVTFPPTPDEADTLYHLSQTDTMINLMCLLREAATFLAYTLNTSYMSKRNVQDIDGLKASINVLVKYYNHFTNNHFDADELVNPFVNFLKQMSQCENENQRKNLREDFAKQYPNAIEKINLLNGYFRLAFEAIEREHLKYVSPELAKKTGTGESSPEEELAAQSHLLGKRKDKILANLDYPSSPVSVRPSKMGLLADKASNKREANKTDQTIGLNQFLKK